MPARVTSPAWYSRATLVSAALTRPLAEVAASAMVCARRGASSFNSFAAATAGAKVAISDPWCPRSRKSGLIGPPIRPAAS